jgi:hypothetical protein
VNAGRDRAPISRQRLFRASIDDLALDARPYGNWLNVFAVESGFQDVRHPLGAMVNCEDVYLALAHLT